MKATQAMMITVVSGLVSFALVGAASADGGTVTITGTSNDTTNTVTVTNSDKTTTTDNSQVTVNNQSSQSVSSGNVSINDVAQVGNATSGSANANNNVTTTIGQPGLGGGTPGSGGGSGTPGGGSTTPGSGSGQGGAKVTAAVAGKGGGSGIELAAAVAMLPDTGASVPVDVSALRALYHNPTLASTSVANTAGLFSGALLAGASLLSLLGAAATVLVNKYRHQVQA